MPLGADVVALERLAARMRGGTQDVREVLSTIDDRLASAWWEGDDARTFRETWQSSHRARLARAADRLERASGEVRTEARAQRRTSGG